MAGLGEEEFIIDPEPDIKNLKKSASFFFYFLYYYATDLDTGAAPTPREAIWSDSSGSQSRRI